MKYQIEKMKLAQYRGAQVLFKYKSGDKWFKVDADHEWDDEWCDYQLANLKRNNRLTRFDLHPFDLSKLKEGDICIDEHYREWTYVGFDKSKNKVVMANGLLRYSFNTSGYCSRSRSVTHIYPK